MAKFTEQTFIELCRDVRDATYVLTPENLVDQLRNAVQEAVGLEIGNGLDPTEAEKYSRMEAQVLDINRIVEARCAEKFDVLGVINIEIVGWAERLKAGTELHSGRNGFPKHS